MSHPKLVTLLGRSDGRDKLYKSLSGLLTVIADVADKRGSLQAKGCRALSASLQDTRSLLRLGAFTADAAKIHALLELFSAQGLKITERKKFFEFFSALLDLCFVLADNAAIFAHHAVVLTSVNAKLLRHRARSCRAVSYALAVIVDVFELRDALRRLEYDPPAARRAARKAALSIVMHSSDVLTSAAAVGYMKQVWHPSDVTAGALTCMSGCIATYLQWISIK